MAVVLVTYDLNKETKRPEITKKLRDTFDSWAMLSESSYAVETSKNPKQVYEVFEPMLDDNDQLYAITLTRPYYGQGLDDVNNWLANSLPN